jgi:8-oxo-dGTP pyrophosphatase MutT (NUDIX family)
MLRQNTLVFVFDPKGAILLAMKKRGHGEGKWNGPGGKVESGESASEAAVRELFEETGIRLAESALERKGSLRFLHAAKPDWDKEVHVFVTRDYCGPDAVETEEMAPKWFKIDDIPYDSMWASDRHWFPYVLGDGDLDFSFHFDGEGRLSEIQSGK